VKTRKKLRELKIKSDIINKYIKVNDKIFKKIRKKKKTLYKNYTRERTIL